MGIPATYVDSTHFTISGEYDGEFPVGRRVQVNQGVDGVPLTSAVSASYNATTDLTTIEVLDAILTSNLVSIKRGVGDKTSLGLHYHTSDHGDAGFIPASALTTEQVATLPNIPSPVGQPNGYVLAVLNNQYVLQAEGLSAMVCLRDTITQVAHGFVVGDVIRRESGSWILAQADTAADAEAIGIVESVDGAVFVVVYLGEITGLTSLVDGTVYFLSAASPGLLTATEPDSSLYISKPMLLATGTTTGIVLGYRGLTRGTLPTL